MAIFYVYVVYKVNDKSGAKTELFNTNDKDSAYRRRYEHELGLIHKRDFSHTISVISYQKSEQS